MPKILSYAASVTYVNADGKRQEDEFPLRESNYAAAQNLALNYVLQVLKLSDFELRIAGL